MSDTEKSFWHTAPGVITAVATLVTALGGVLAILVQNDIIGGARPGESQVVAAPPEGGGAAPAGPDATPAWPVDAAPAGPLEAKPATAWAGSSAVLVRRDGTSATVKAATVGLACSTGTIEFKTGQRVSLELVRTIQIDAVYTENASADGVVTLLDGRELTDPIHTWNCPVSGANELGPLSVPLKDIRRIDFQR